METKNQYFWIYLTGFFLILALPLLNLPPWFSPPAWGKTIVFRSILAIMLFLYIAQTLIKGKFTIKTSKVFYILLGLLGIFGLATIFSADRLFSFFGNPYRSGGFLNFASYIIFAILAFLVLKKSDWTKVLNFSLIVGVFVSLIAIFQNFHILSKIFVPVIDQPWSTIGGSTFLAMYLLFLFFIALIFTIKSIKNLDRGWFFYLPSLLLFTYIIYLTISRAAYIGLFIGLIYFFFAYPSSGKKLKKIKIAVAILGCLVLLFIAYVNIFPNTISQISNEEATINRVIPRLSIKRALNDPRLSVWQTSTKAIINKPLLGYGPENFSIAFDEHYDPSLPNVSMISGITIPITWYDRAHSVIFEIGATAGIPALIIYLGLFTALFIGLKEKTLINHGLRTIFIAYLTVNLFGFDVFDTYLLFFLLVAYSMFLITENYSKKVIRINIGFLTYPITALLFIGLVGFIWIYNIKPFQVNTEINKNAHLSQTEGLEPVINNFEKIIPSDTFINEYLRASYLDTINAYMVKYPHKIINITPRGIRVLKEALEIRPKYTRYWLLLGTYYNLLLENYQSIYPEFVEEWKNEADKAFAKASELSPLRQEIILRWTRTHIFTGNFERADELIKDCLRIDPDLGDCYWNQALMHFKNNDAVSGKESVRMTEEKGYPVYTDEGTLLELRKMYSYLENPNDYIDDFCDINIKLYYTNSENPDYAIKALACYIKQGKSGKATTLANYIKLYVPKNTEIVNNLMKQLK